MDTALMGKHLRKNPRQAVRDVALAAVAFAVITISSVSAAPPHQAVPLDADASAVQVAQIEMPGAAAVTESDGAATVQGGSAWPAAASEDETAAPSDTVPPAEPTAPSQTATPSQTAVEPEAEPAPQAEVSPQRAGPPKPLLMDGKTALFQRVLTRPGATLVDAPQPGAAGTPVQSFSVFYVYARQSVGDVDWVEVGAGSQGPTDGWVRQSALIDWKQTMTVAFTNPSGRPRALFFRDRGKLLDLLESETLVTQSRALREQALGGPVAEDFPVVSIEPAVHVNIKDEFYLLPILSAEEIYLSSGFPTRLLQVASVTREAKEDEDVLSRSDSHDELVQGLGQREEALRDFKAAVVFVIDATTSMGPYIDRTRQAVRTIADTLQHDALADKVGFGLVAYRDSTDAVPGLEYVTRVYSGLEDGADHQAFLSKVEAVEPATVSSKGFVEDAYAGLAEAIEKLDWADYGGRYVVLITDAGARPSQDPLSVTKMDAAQIRRLALDNTIAVFTLHLLTEEGQSDHALAAEQYKALSDHPEGSLYFPVETGSVVQFGQRLDALTHALSTQIARAAEGELADQPGAAAQSVAAVAAVAQDQPTQDQTAIEQSAQRVGLAMQLAYLGTKKGAKAPTVFNAWLSDRDFENPATAALDVRVLLSKNQLSDLQDALKLVVEAGKLGQISPQDFFDQLKSAAAALSRDPGQVGREEARNLGDLGLMGEYLEDLPYQSKVMSIDQDLWLSWSITEQEAFLNEIEAKIQLFRSYHDDVDRWVALDDGRVPGDAVYPVPLEALP